MLPKEIFFAGPGIYSRHTPRSLSEIAGLPVRFGISDGAGGQRETVGSAYRGVVPTGYGWKFQRQRRLGAERAPLKEAALVGAVPTSRYARVVYASALGLAALVMTVLLNQPAPDIVYKAF
jgi:hypothetical protein